MLRFTRNKKKCVCSHRLSWNGERILWRMSGEVAEGGENCVLRLSIICLSPSSAAFYTADDMITAELYMATVRETRIFNVL
jgi:hypothetical protein